jgi:hypothetical protein
MADKVQRLVDLFGYDSDTEELAGKGKQCKANPNNQRLVKEENAGKDIVHAGRLRSSCVDIDVTRRPPGFHCWKLTKIDCSDQRVLNPIQIFFILRDYQLQDFEIASFLTECYSTGTGV